MPNKEPGAIRQLFAFVARETAKCVFPFFLLC